jgi:hypothetical protein
MPMDNLNFKAIAKFMLKACILFRWVERPAVDATLLLAGGRSPAADSLDSSPPRARKASGTVLERNPMTHRV